MLGIVQWIQCSKVDASLAEQWVQWNRESQKKLAVMDVSFAILGESDFNSFSPLHFIIAKDRDVIGDSSSCEMYNSHHFVRLEVAELPCLDYLTSHVASQGCLLNVRYARCCSCPAVLHSSWSQAWSLGLLELTEWWIGWAMMLQIVVEYNIIED